MSNDNKLTLGLVVAVGLLATASAAHGDRIYLFAIGNDYGSHEYFDDAGYLKGFGAGLMDIVCEEAGIDCRIVVDRYSSCWDFIGKHEAGGEGLLGRWYDACMGWYMTVERIRVFQFSQPYQKKPATHFFVLNDRSFNTAKNNILNSKIVFLRAWPSDDKCMARVTGATLSGPNITYANTPTDAIKLLSNGYDAIFATINTFKTFKTDHTESGLKIAGPEYFCSLAGAGIMSRKDNNVIVKWNLGFNKLKDTGRFKKYCATANAEHIAKGNVTCIDSF